MATPKNKAQRKVWLARSGGYVARWEMPIAGKGVLLATTLDEALYNARYMIEKWGAKKVSLEVMERHNEPNSPTPRS